MRQERRRISVRLFRLTRRRAAAHTGCTRFISSDRTRRRRNGCRRLSTKIRTKAEYGTTRPACSVGWEGLTRQCRLSGRHSTRENGQLSREDIKGRKYYQIANGDIAEGITVTLREVKIGDAVLRNVDASVVHSQKAPLLLGQSVLERFGTITIDNINSKLLIQQ